MIYALVVGGVLVLLLQFKIVRIACLLFLAVFVYHWTGVSKGCTRVTDAQGVERCSKGVIDGNGNEAKRRYTD